MNEYWRNPQITYTQPTNESIVTDPHCLFYDPSVPVEAIKHQTLQDLCTWANENITEYGLESFYTTPRNYYDLANLVKFNMWIKDIRAQGIVKPMLLTYTGNRIYDTNTGESRLRCLEIIPHIKTVTALITTHKKYADRFTHLLEIKNIDQLFELCNTPVGTEYTFKFTDQKAPYGIEWYEYNSQKTGEVMPAEDLCVRLIKNYLNEHPSVVFSPDWFSKAVDWNLYKTN